MRHWDAVQFVCVNGLLLLHTPPWWLAVHVRSCDETSVEYHMCKSFWDDDELSGSSAAFCHRVPLAVCRALGCLSSIWTLWSARMVPSRLGWCKRRGALKRGRLTTTRLDCCRIMKLSLLDWWFLSAKRMAWLDSLVSAIVSYVCYCYYHLIS